MADKKKFYTVWQGLKPGVYEGWDACKKQIDGQKGAQYMGFLTRGQAETAFRRGYRETLAARKAASGSPAGASGRAGKPDCHSIAVDAASSGNPGKMEYRGVDTRTGQVLFHKGPFEQGTNNIGEFLAIVHGLALLKQQGSDRCLYTDSRTAMSWVRKKTCNTKLAETPANAALFELVRRAEAWLRRETYSTRIRKWETRDWGEIPADFGRK